MEAPTASLFLMTAGSEVSDPGAIICQTAQEILRRSARPGYAQVPCNRIPGYRANCVAVIRPTPLTRAVATTTSLGELWHTLFGVARALAVD